MKIDIAAIQSFYPPILHAPAHTKHLVKEYLQYRILDFLSSTKFAHLICFIGVTNLRLVHGIDRFSEDLDFDNKNLSKDDFFQMTDDIARFLKNSGFYIEIEDKPKDDKLRAFRRNITFPAFLYDNGLSPFKDEKFLIKIESQDQGFIYSPVLRNIKGTGQIFNFQVAPDDILCSMKLSALLDRKKGRDFYDSMFLLSKTKPNYSFLNYRIGISNFNELKRTLFNLVGSVNLSIKSRDFEHLLFNKDNAKKILFFKDFIEHLSF